MKRWKKLSLALVVLIALFIIIGFFLPSHCRVERTLTIRAPEEALFSRVSALKRWPEWTAWTTNRFPDMKVRFEGSESGVGAVMIAEGKSSGNGVVNIVRADVVKGVWYDLDFEHGTQIFHGAITFERISAGLKVTWTLETDMSANPLKRWAGLILDQLMGSDMEKGLRNLKEQTERSASPLQVIK